MAFQSKSLSAAVYTNGWTHWHYRTQDEIGAVLDSAYFAEHSQYLRVGDFISINAKKAGGLEGSHALVVVTANNGAAGVTLEPGFLAG